MKRWILCLLACLVPLCARADVMALSGGYQPCRENEKGEYLVLERQGNGAKAVAYDQEDEMLWDAVFEADRGETAPWASCAANGGWVIAGASSAQDEQWHEGWYDRYERKTDGWLVMLDEAGRILWERWIGGSGSDVFWDVYAGEGYLIAVGESDSADGDVLLPENRQRDGWMVCLDMNGEILWQKTLGAEYDDALRGTVILERGILSAGWRTGEDGEKHGWWILTNKKGDVISERLEKESSALYDLSPGAEGVLAVGVYRNSAWLLLLDSEGMIVNHMIRQDDFITRALSAAWYPGGFWAVGGESVEGTKKTDWLVRYHQGQVELVQGTYEVEEEVQ